MPMYTILYVDDEPDLLEIGKAFLEDTGDFKVFTMPSANGGLQALRRGSFDAIISDYQMPGIDGIETLRSIRKINTQVPIIMISAATTVRTAVNALKQGADDYINKPFDINDIKTVVNNALNNERVASGENIVFPLGIRILIESVVRDMGEQNATLEEATSVFETRLRDLINKFN